MPIDVLADRLGSNRGALYQTLHDARRNCASISTTGLAAGRSRRSADGRSDDGRALACYSGRRVPSLAAIPASTIDGYVELEPAGEDAEAAIPGMRAHFLGCPACCEEYESLSCARRGEYRRVRMSAVREGGCSCGAVRYRLTSEPLFTNCCHCLNCQRQTGSAFVINLLIEADRVELLAGDPQPVDVPRDDGSSQRIFRCPDCQVAVFSLYTRPEVRFVRGGTLDDPSRWRPTPTSTRDRS